MNEHDVIVRLDERGYRPLPAFLRSWNAAGAVQGLRETLYVAGPDGKASPTFARLWWAAFQTRPPMDALFKPSGAPTNALVRSWPA